MTPGTRIAAILGPTASGKTALALALHARGLPIEIVGCDASQMVRDMTIGTAAPTAAERARVRHHLVGVLAPTERIDAARYARLADAAIGDITARGRWPVLVGGTGLYHRALVRGLADIPAVPAAVRAQLAERWRERGAAALHAELQAVDPVYAAVTPAANRQRVLRALEVHVSTGKAFSAWHAEHDARAPRYLDLAIVLEPPRDTHLPRLADRARAMIPGLLAEARALLDAGVPADAHALQAIGYRAAVAAIGADEVDHEALGTALAAAHRRYAKRQRTWFRKLDAAYAVAAADPTTEAVVADLAAALRAHFEAG